MRPLTTSVTALRFITLKDQTTYEPFNVLFAGIGNQVHVFKAASEHSAIVAKVLPDVERIHGFSEESENRVIVHGGRFAAIVTASISAGDFIGELAVGASTEFNDWVWGSRWIHTGRFLAVACGHSTVLICDRNDLRRSFRVQCEEREITWSTTLFMSESNASLRAVAGTSFGDILIWNVLDQVTEKHLSLKLQELGNGDDSPLVTRKGEPAHRLQAHDGPIMKLTLSKDAKRMVSASVDRSVRVWQKSCSAQCSICKSDGCFVPVFCHYGHLARIWDVGFLDDESLRVVSVGEDRTCRVWSGTKAGQQLSVLHGHAGRNVWSLDVQPANRASALVATGGEDGCIKIRSVAIPSENEDLDLGKSGSTNSCGARKCVSGAVTLPGNYPNPRKSGGSHNESGRTLLLVANDILFVSTDFGRILAAKIKISSEATQKEQPHSERNNVGLLDEDVSWTELFRDSTGTAYTPSSLAYCDGLLFGGQTNGDMTVLRISGLTDFAPVATKIVTIPVFLNVAAMVMGLFAAKPEEKSACSLFAATGSGELYHWQIEEGQDGGITSTYCRTYRQRNPTKSALVTSVLYLFSEGVVVVGDRGGRVLLYDASIEDSLEHSSTYTQSSERIVHPFSICRPHSDRVSSISMAPVAAVNGSVDQETTAACDLVTTGFDGRIARLRVEDVKTETQSTDKSERKSMKVLSSQKSIEHVDTIARIVFPCVPQCMGDIQTNASSIHNRHCIIGFRSADITIWDVQQRNELFRTNCGNWRRAFDVCLDLTDTSTAGGGNRLTVERMTVAFWRSGKLYLVRTVGSSQDGQLANRKEAEPQGQLNSKVPSQSKADQYVQSIRAGFHGQRANAVSWIDGSRVLLTASEDTTINVTQLHDGEWRNTQTLSRHISGVNSLSTLRISNNSLLTFSGGGSDEVVTWISSDAQGPWKDVCTIAIGGRSRERKALHRVMCVSAVDGKSCECDPTCGIVVVGRSDGSVGLLRSTPATDERYRQAGKEWNCEVVQLVTQHHGAVLCCATTTAQVAGRDVLLAVTGDSQGAIVLWIAELKRPCREWRVQAICTWTGEHDGGVNALAVCVNVDSARTELVLVSGGDDERVRISVAVVQEKGAGAELAICVAQRTKVWTSPLGMHSAAVTGLCFAEEQEKSESIEPDWVVAVTGADQRVNWLQVRRKGAGMGEMEWNVRHIREASSRANVLDVGAIAARTKREGGRVSGIAVVAGCGLEAVDASWAP